MILETICILSSFWMTIAAEVSSQLVSIPRMVVYESLSRDPTLE